MYPDKAKSPVPVGAQGIGVEQVKGIEPSCSAWEADILPLNYTRKSFCIITGSGEKCKHFFYWIYRIWYFKKFTKAPLQINLLLL